MRLRKPAREKGNTTLEAAACLSAGLPDIEAHFTEQELELADANYPGIGLKQLLATAARANGWSGYESNDLESILRAAFSPDVRASGFSTINVAGVLSNVANRFLRAGFDAIDQSWRQVAAVGTVRDFKETPSYALTGDFEYRKLGPTGEITHATIGEQPYTNRADTYARMVTISRTDLINDDLGALTSLPKKLGRGAATAFNRIFWTTLLDDAAFFTAGNGNFLDGVTPGTDDTRLNLEGLARAETAFLGQTDPDGEPLGSTPAVLLVPTALGVTARTLMSSTEVRDNTASASYGTANPFVGRYRPVTSPYLGNAAYPGSSTTAWYLLADPEDIATIEVVFLSGQTAPQLDTAEASFQHLGISMRGYHDWGCRLIEPRAGIKMKGAA